VLPGIKRCVARKRNNVIFISTLCKSMGGNLFRQGLRRRTNEQTISYKLSDPDSSDLPHRTRDEEPGPGALPWSEAASTSRPRERFQIVGGKVQCGQAPGSDPCSGSCCNCHPCLDRISAPAGRLLPALFVPNLPRLQSSPQHSFDHLLKEVQSAWLRRVPLLQSCDRIRGSSACATHAE
jgi:hypothetical protein